MIVLLHKARLDSTSQEERRARGGRVEHCNTDSNEEEGATGTLVMRKPTLTAD